MFGKFSSNWLIIFRFQRQVVDWVANSYENNATLQTILLDRYMNTTAVTWVTVCDLVLSCYLVLTFVTWFCRVTCYCRGVDYETYEIQLSYLVTC